MMATNISRNDKVPGQGAKSKRSMHTKDEFFVRRDNITLAIQFKDKIENMYEIQINMEEETEDGLWLILIGDPVDRRNAKNYITAMCNPSEKKQVQFPSASELTDPGTLEYIEKRTNAFIRPLKKIALFEISGTELAVTLALSEIEELAGKGIEGCDDMSESEDNLDDGIIEISPSTTKGSSRLSDVLERALSSHSDGVCSVDDYKNTCPSVQRVLVNCLQNEDDNDGYDEDSMFGDGKLDEEVLGRKSESGSKSLTMYYVNEESRNTPEMDKMEHPKSFHGEVENIAKLKISETSSNPLLTKEQEYLKSFGLSVGFEESKVIQAIKFVDERTRPSDFLDILNSLPDEGNDNNDDDENHDISDDDSVIIESETVEYVNDDNSSDKDKTGEKSELPEGYKERLIRDFMAEGENCSREELIRRNNERQQLLRKNFQQKQQQSQRSPENTPTKSKKKKRKKKKSKTTENEQEKVSEEQTCVMKVWNAASDGESKCTKEEPFQTTPTRKNKVNNTPAQAFQPQMNYRQNSPSRAQHQCGGENQWAQPKKTKLNIQNVVPQKGKPTQIVNPVNVPKAANRVYNQRAQHFVENSKLRYIVIDGSNVAMTHGNGKHFSCKGIKICVEYFRQRGHDEITVFVPQWRQYRPSDNNPILDQDILQELKSDGTLVFTPSRKIDQKLVASYDDRFVLELAEAEEGIIVSNDQYRDLMTEKSAWKKIIHERLLMFSFVKDRFMPPNDPLGRDGPCLDDFLKHKSQQGNPANPGNGHQFKQQQQQQHYTPQSHGLNYVQQGQSYLHPQSYGNFSAPVQSRGPLQINYVPVPNLGSYAGAANVGPNHLRFHQPYLQQSNFPIRNQTQTYDSTDTSNEYPKSPRQHQNGQGQHWKTKGPRIPRTEQQSNEFFQELRKIFPDDDQEEKIRTVLKNHIYEHDFAKLTNDCMNVLF